MESVSRPDLEAAIQTAFSNVVLGGGMSLRQAQKVDDYNGVVDAEYHRLPKSEVTNDWSRVSIDELDRDCVAHLDAEGFRYYIPAFMLSVLENYDAASMRVIGTLLSLYPRQDTWEYHMNQYSVLSDDQKRAIALFVRSSAALAPLDDEDQRAMDRANRNYWHQFA
jgi:hypothetical protein